MKLLHFIFFVGSVGSDSTDPTESDSETWLNKKSLDKILVLVDQISPTNCVAELVDADSVNHIVVFLTGQVRALLLEGVMFFCSVNPDTDKDWI
jgi:hypothetical protein